MDSQHTQSRPADDRSLGELVASATRDLSQLVHKEVELAKVEIKKDIAAAGKGAGLFGGAGLTGLFALIFLSFAMVYGIHGLGLDLGWAFLIVGLVYLVAAAVLALSGKKKISQVGPPERTIETVKDDIAMAKSATSGSARASARS
jgi:hypothetical protein